MKGRANPEGMANGMPIAGGEEVLGTAGFSSDGRAYSWVWANEDCEWVCRDSSVSICIPACAKILGPFKSGTRH
jgi:hypothetical protein